MATGDSGAVLLSNYQFLLVLIPYNTPQKMHGFQGHMIIFGVLHINKMCDAWEEAVVSVGEITARFRYVSSKYISR